MVITSLLLLVTPRHQKWSSAVASMTCSTEQPPVLALCTHFTLHHRLVDDSFTCNPQRKTAAFGDVLPFLHSLDPTNTVIAGNLECASETTLMPALSCHMSHANKHILVLRCSAAVLSTAGAFKQRQTLG